jgi:TonB family protein
MNNLLSYLVQSGISLALFYGIFWLFMRNDTSFLTSRLYLLFSAVFSMIIPFITIKIPVQASTSNYVYLLEAVVITPGELTKSISSNQNLNQLWWLVYFAGAGFVLIRFLIQLFRLGWMIQKFGVIKSDQLNIVKTNQDNSAFSFLNFIFLGSNITDPKQLDKIIAHEKMHMRQKHSIDLILLEFLTVVQWFNPFIWFCKSTIRNLHEYLADQGVLLDGFSKADYQQMLVNQTFGIQYNYVTNHFNQSLIKRRFIMMSKNQKNRFQYFKAMVVLPVSMIMVLFFSISVVPDLIAQETTKPEKKQKESTLVEQSSQNEEVFVVVEDMPQYPGGEEARIKFMIENIKYPEEARKKGVEGTVYVTFVIEKDGTINSIKILRGIGSGCDEEAIRVISLMPKWKPGMQDGKTVRFQFNMPIKFSLDKGEKKVTDINDPEKKTPQPPPEKK